MPDQPPHQVLVQQAQQDHPGHLQRGLVGDPEAVDEDGLQPHPPGHRGDLGAAAVDDHGLDADQPEQGDVEGERLGDRAVVHDRAADLDHHGRPGVLAEEGEGVQQDADLGPGALADVGCDGDRHVVYSLLTRTYS